MIYLLISLVLLAKYKNKILIGDEMNKIQDVFTVSPLTDDPPKGDIRVVASIGGGQKTIVSDRSYELCMSVCFEARGGNLDSRQVNPLLRQFRQLLEDYRFEEGKIKCWPKRVDEFQSELVGTDLLICSQNILWGIYNPAGFSDDRIRVKLLRDVREIRVDEQKSIDGISIHMTDAIFEGSRRHGRWPRDPFEG